MLRFSPVPAQLYLPVRPPVGRTAEPKAAAVSTLLGVVIGAFSAFTLVVVAWAFVWAARKDGEEDQAVQKRLGIRRRIRLER